MNGDFNPNNHLVQLKSKQGAQDYLPVQWRLVWFRDQCPEGTITTEMIHLDLDRECSVEAFVWNAQTRKSEKVMKTAQGIAVFRATITNGKGGCATGTGSECAADFSDFIEKAETKSIGRALAGLGYGTQFAPELNEGRVVDAPVNSKPTEQQVAQLKKRALSLNLAHDADEWTALLKAAGVEQLANAADLAKVDVFLSGYEQQQAKSA